jgi:hypothetical protein
VLLNKEEGDSMQRLFGLTILVILAILAGGCSDSKTGAPTTTSAHPADWLDLHSSDPAAAGLADSCRVCHGANFEGSGKAVSCFDCHASGPPFALHPSWWNGDAFNEHRHFHNEADPARRMSWTTCAVALCHGSQLKGGGNGPSCFSAEYTGPGAIANTCHATGPPVPPPHATATAYSLPENHGYDAKDAGNFNLSMGNYCINCHGRPTNQFDGGFVADPAILNIAQANCSSCHPDATAHPTNWVRADNPIYFHSTVSAETISGSCALCHNTLGPGVGIFANAPSCFSSQFTNTNGLTNGCHPGGPGGGAPHAVPFIDPVLHGPLAKANLVYCQTCHATAGGQGSNPTFDVPIGNLLNGCEDCHAPGTAHPAEADRWTFNYDLTSTRRTHFASGNVLAACALCHNVSAGDTGGNATACTACHISAPLFQLQCTVCHLSPPAGAADDTLSPTPVAHGAVATIPLHEECAICHGARDDGTGSLIVKGADYQLFDAATPALSQGGDHLDGRMELNGPSGTGAGYNITNFGCDNACHPNNATHQLPNSSGLDPEYGNFGSGGAACDTCHGYPPDGNADLTGATPVNHLFGDLGATLKASHNDCLICHGTRDDGTGSHSQAANYDVALDHNTGSINMNSATQYIEANFGCDLACHGNDAAHQLSDSALPVVLGDYGGGGGAGACSACHDTGVGGAPVVIQNVSPHAGTFTCEDCHTAHGQGTVIIPNNPAVGINYPAADHLSGISLGGTATTALTEAEICWGCHANYLISEWGINTDTNGAANNYDFGSLNQSNWIGATWSSGGSQFSYKTGSILSTHTANPQSLGGPSSTNNHGQANPDTVNQIRCSYCHDVHNVGAQGFRMGYDNGGLHPYLCGTWMGNPYREDGAPQAGGTWSSNGRFGAVPRAGYQANEYGGYQIDQNNSNPTTGGNPAHTSTVAAAWSFNNNAGLCQLCHGSNVNTMNQFGLASDDWVGTNGHANAVIGGTGTGAANIFSMADRNPSGAVLFTGSGSAKGNPRQAYGNAGRFDDPVPSGDNTADYRTYGLRSQDSSGYQMQPRVTASEPYAYQAYNWGASVDNTLDTQYHKFSCSKCHNPHASRLPRLMITNCLDTKHNTWDDDKTTPTTTTLGLENRGVPLSNATSAQNCHRLGDPSFANTTGGGWNNVTPW